MLFAILFFFLCTVGVLILSNKIENIFPEYQNVIAAILAISLGFSFFKAIEIILKKLAVTTDKLKISNLRKGFSLGFIVLFFSVSVLYLSGYTLSLEKFGWEKIFDQILFQLRPAILEEIGFRFGIVSIASHFFGNRVALILGSIPFGVVHLLNFTSGEAIYWEYIIGTTVAGIFLTSVYFSYGLLGAIGAHYSWNVFASISSQASTFKQENLEAGLWTYCILISCSLLLFRLRVSKKN